MSYQQTVNEVRAAAIAVNPDGRFDHGRHVDLSQMFEGDYPFIYLYPFTIQDPAGEDFLVDSTLLVGFWMQDKPESTNAEREQLIAEMDVLSQAFLSKLKESKLVQIIGRPSREPQYSMYQGTLSGFAARFQYQNFDPCPPEIF